VTGTHTQVTVDIAERLEAIDTRTAQLEAWVEVVMRTLATLGLEGLLCELDDARGADYGDDCSAWTRTGPRATGTPAARGPAGPCLGIT
jgi:hypothetical protein